MKSLVYYDFRKDDDCNIIIPEDRLNQIINDIYNAGYNDGKKDNIYTSPSNKYESLRAY